jgi:hypothetical protein
LQADDDQTRLQALAQIDAFKEQPNKVVERPSEVELRYASLGTGEEQQAIVAIYLGPMLFGAVAARQNGIWIRIASFSCWCRYESGDLIGNFVGIEPGPDCGSELVLRASGGGTGVYSQNEARFATIAGNCIWSFRLSVVSKNVTRPLQGRTNVTLSGDGSIHMIGTRLSAAAL